MVGPYAGLLVLSLVGIPLLLVFLFLRRPFDSRSVPRDGMAVRGKGKITRTLGVWPSKAFEDTLRDKAADQPESGRDTP